MLEADNQGLATEDLRNELEEVIARIEAPVTFLIGKAGDWYLRLNNAEAFLVGLVSLFVIYSVGELTIALGRASPISFLRDHSLMLIGEAAKFENAIIVREYENFASSLVVLQGLTSLITLYVGTAVFHLVETWDYFRFGRVLAIAALCQLLVVLVQMANQRYFRQILEPLQKTSQENET
ncbi:hypothetical protein [Marivita hallyeonensis]|uniref:hypothetical protein n=1 Tax=Marivita hallyeonensis TaxID=996342 RepID=UPI0009354916|nr:hypothetical protein [Marivita hallyeonensis]